MAGGKELPPATQTKDMTMAIQTGITSALPWQAMTSISRSVNPAAYNELSADALYWLGVHPAKVLEIAESGCSTSDVAQEVIEGHPLGLAMWERLCNEAARYDKYDVNRLAVASDFFDLVILGRQEFHACPVCRQNVDVRQYSEVTEYHCTNCDIIAAG